MKIQRLLLQSLLTAVLLFGFIGMSRAQVCTPEQLAACAALCGGDSAKSATTASASPCTATCGAPTGSSTCGTPDLITNDPALNMAERTGPSPKDLGLTDLEPELSPIRELFRTPGLAAALVKDGQLSAIGTTGIRQAGSNERVELDDQFHLGSCGKAITTTIAAIMVDRGMIEWATTIGESFPDLEPTMHSLYKNVTLRQLLTHRGGFGSRTSIFDEAIAQYIGPITERRRDLVRYATANVPAAQPGTQFIYSDIGYTVAGAMLEQAGGEAWETLVTKLLAEPLGLNSLGFWAPGIDEAESVAHGHILTEGKLVALGVGPGEDLANPAIGPAGTVHMSIADWAKFALFHLQGARGEPTDILSPAGFKALHGDVYDQGYVLGWFKTDNRWGPKTAFTHTGSCGAWGALIWILPEQNAAMVAATNYGGGSGFQALQLATDKIGERYLRELNGNASIQPTGSE